MKQTSFNWYESDGKLVFARIWQADDTTTAKAVICLIHGMGEHSGRYKHVAQFFVNHGYAVIACDLRGHGQSEGKRGHVTSYQILLDQVDRTLAEAGKRFPGEPKFIYGHSMGGNIVVNHALERKPLVEGVVASAPWLTLPNPPTKGQVRLAKFANFFGGSLTQPNKLPLDKLSRDKSVAVAYEADPLVHDQVSGRLFLTCFQQAQKAMDNAATLSIPMLLMHGTADELTGYDGSREFAKKAGDMATYKEWAGFYHEIHNEPEKMEVLQYALDWMEKQLETTMTLS